MNAEKRADGVATLRNAEGPWTVKHRREAAAQIAAAIAQYDGDERS
jgi:hypothetical protein